ncbi:hypothetical protein Taro_048548, partial [Colocasia esculenta]|nr:hypothetical protein [Colocasia esculenta]
VPTVAPATRQHRHPRHQIAPLTPLRSDNTVVAPAVAQSPPSSSDPVAVVAVGSGEFTPPPPRVPGMYISICKYLYSHYLYILFMAYILVTTVGPSSVPPPVAVCMYI